MSNVLISIFILSVIVVSVVLLTSSDKNNGLLSGSNPMTQFERDHWFAGKAEISSYSLSQSRYGANRKGSAVLIFVTEPFSPSKFVKADAPTKNDISVLKLNATKKFNTGIYPYSIMTSTFYPFEGNGHALKVSNSIQEWCGHAYLELLNKNKFEITVNSYFEGESKIYKIDKVLLEDELWTMLKINPKSIPTGELKIFPSAEYLRLTHQEEKVYNATISNIDGSLKVIMPTLNRSLTIEYGTQFPYQILSWSETVRNQKGQEQTTTAKLKKSMMVDYWNKNAEADSIYREELGLVDY